MGKSVDTYVGSRYEETKDLGMDVVCGYIKHDLDLMVKEGFFDSGKYDVNLETLENFQGSVHIDVVLDTKEIYSNEKTWDYARKVEHVANAYNRKDGCVMKCPNNVRYFCTANILTQGDILEAEEFISKSE